MKPIISTTSSVLGFFQWEQFEFQPAALGTPTTWTAIGLPTGVSINAGTGLISGAAEKPGVYVVTVFAENADGVSEGVRFPMAFEATVGDPTVNAYDLRVDLGTRAVTGYTGATGALFSAKFGDDLIFRIQFERGGIPVAGLELDALHIYLKEQEQDAILCSSGDAAFADLGGGVFLVYLPLVGDELQRALDAYPTDKARSFPGICELEWLAVNELGVGPNPARGSSQSFEGAIVKDLGEGEAP